MLSVSIPLKTTFLFFRNFCKFEKMTEIVRETLSEPVKEVSKESAFFQRQVEYYSYKANNSAFEFFFKKPV